jgi:nucleoside-diphosphate-sugar epimerase
MGMRAFIIGGTGQIGRAVASNLIERGWDVVISSRRKLPPTDVLIARGATCVTLDRDQPGALARAVDAGADAVIDTIAFDDGHARQLLDLQGSVGSFVVISSASVYRDEHGRTFDEGPLNGYPEFSEPIVETQSTVDPGPQTYSTRKAALERLLLDRATLPVTILRPCAIYGPHSTHRREWWFVKRMLDRRPVIPLAYAGRSRFHTTAVENIARLITTTIDLPGNRILNIADPSAPTVEEIGMAIARHMHFCGKIRPLEVGDDRGSAPIGSTPWSIPGSFVVSMDRAAALGYKPAASYDDAVKHSCDWLSKWPSEGWRDRFPILAGYPRNLFDYAAEDIWLSRAEVKN